MGRFRETLKATFCSCMSSRDKTDQPLPQSAYVQPADADSGEVVTMDLDENELVHLAKNRFQEIESANIDTHADADTGPDTDAENDTQAPQPFHPAPTVKSSEPLKPAPMNTAPMNITPMNTAPMNTAEPPKVAVDDDSDFSSESEHTISDSEELPSDEEDQQSSPSAVKKEDGETSEKPLPQMTPARQKALGMIRTCMEPYVEEGMTDREMERVNRILRDLPESETMVEMMALVDTNEEGLKKAAEIAARYVESCWEYARFSGRHPDSDVAEDENEQDVVANKHDVVAHEQDVVAHKDDVVADGQDENTRAVEGNDAVDQHLIEEEQRSGEMDEVESACIIVNSSGGEQEQAEMLTEDEQTEAAGSVHERTQTEPQSEQEGTTTENRTEQENNTPEQENNILEQASSTAEEAEKTGQETERTGTEAESTAEGAKSAEQVGNSTIETEPICEEQGISVKIGVAPSMNFTSGFQSLVQELTFESIAVAGTSHVSLDQAPALAGSDTDEAEEPQLTADDARAVTHIEVFTEEREYTFGTMSIEPAFVRSASKQSALRATLADLDYQVVPGATSGESCLAVLDRELSFGAVELPVCLDRLELATTPLQETPVNEITEEMAVRDEKIAAEEESAEREEERAEREDVTEREKAALAPAEDQSPATSADSLIFIGDVNDIHRGD